MSMKPCIVCGTPSAGTRCDEHPERHSGPSASPRAIGYTSAWDKLSRRARRLQPFCTDCGTDEDLTLDHLPSAWERQAQGKKIRLAIDVEVVCRSCNSKRGAARGNRSRTSSGGDTPSEGGTEWEANSRMNLLQSVVEGLGVDREER